MDNPQENDYLGDQAERSAPRAHDEAPWAWPQYPRNAPRNYVRSHNEQFTGWEGDYLEAMRQSGVVRAACIAARVTRTLVAKRRERDPMFNQACKEAYSDALDAMEGAAFSRAVMGVTRTKPIYYKGRKVGEETITEYSDGLLQFLLKAGRPEKFRETVTHDHQVSIVEQEARRLAEKEGVDPERVVEEAKRLMGL